MDIVDVEQPDKNFIVFESLTAESSQKIFYVVNTEEMKPTVPGQPNTGNLPNYELKIGRGADSDVRVTDDISVSRNHCYI